MNIYRDDVAFDLYIQAALEEECDSSDEDLNALTREIERLTAENKRLGAWVNQLRDEADMRPSEYRDHYREKYDRLRAALQWAVQEIRRADNLVGIEYIADTLDVHLSQEKR